MKFIHFNTKTSRTHTMCGYSQDNLFDNEEITSNFTKVTCVGCIDNYQRQLEIERRKERKQEMLPAHQQTEHYRRIGQFMSRCEQVMPSTPTVPDEEVRILRAKLILEEALETVQKGLAVVVKVKGGLMKPSEGYPISEESLVFEINPHKEPDIVEIADGCADVSVVTIGTLLACGIDDKPLLEEVDRSNLEKFENPRCPNCKITGHYIDLQPRRKFPTRSCSRCGTTFEDKDIGGYKREDGKWEKPYDHTPPNILQVLQDQGYEKESPQELAEDSKKESHKTVLYNEKGEPEYIKEDEETFRQATEEEKCNYQVVFHDSQKILRDS